MGNAGANLVLARVTAGEELVPLSMKGDVGVRMGWMGHRGTCEGVQMPGGELLHLSPQGPGAGVSAGTAQGAVLGT